MSRVGLIPAAGLGTRLGTLPCSKEVFPVGWAADASGAPRPVVAAESLIRKFGIAGVDRAFVVLRDGKWDIPSYLGDGARLGVPLGYLMMRWPFGQPFTLDAAHPFLGEATILFGFPDILFDPEDAFLRLLDRLESSGADVALGLFPARRPEKMDMVELNDAEAVQEIVIKPTGTTLRFTWIIAAWTGTFTAFLHQFVARSLERMEEERRDASATVIEGRELYLGDVLQAALRDGLHIEAVTFDAGRYIDIGTPEELRAAVRAGTTRDHSGPAPIPPPGGTTS
jgi:glucose-1-phosphate thymidylyltransferase